MPWIATGSMDRTVNVWRIGDGVSRTGTYLTEDCVGRRLQMNNHSFYKKTKQTVSSGSKPRSHLERLSLPKRVFWEISSRRSSHYVRIAVWLRCLEEQLWLMFIGAAAQTTTEPQRGAVMEVNPLKKPTWKKTFGILNEKVQSSDIWRPWSFIRAAPRPPLVSLMLTKQIPSQWRSAFFVPLPLSLCFPLPLIFFLLTY